MIDDITIANLVTNYFQDLQFCHTHLYIMAIIESGNWEVGTISMELITQTSRWVRGERLKSEPRLPPIPVDMDDLT